MARFVRLGSSLGPTVALWFAVPLLLRTSTGSPWAIAIGLGVAGAVGHVGCRLVSNRGWFAGERSVVELAVAAVATSAAFALLLCGVAWSVGRDQSRAPADGADGLALAAAWSVASIALLSAFAGRVEFRGWILSHRDIRDRALPFATAPIGPDRASVHTVLEDLGRALHDEGEDSGARRPGSTASDLGVIDTVRQARARVHVASDDRYRRAVPWTVAFPLLVSFANTLTSPSRASVEIVGESPATQASGAAEASIVLGPICDLIADLTRQAGVDRVLVNRHADAVELSIDLDSDRVDVDVAPSTVRALGRFDVTISRPTRTSLLCRVADAVSSPAPSMMAIEAQLNAKATLIDESEHSQGARAVYRRGGDVIKVHRHGYFDTKPTLLEDEFHLLRRLRGRSTRFPVAKGYGIDNGFGWIAYSYVDGTPLDRWLLAQPDGGRSRLLAIGVDLDEILVELADARVAHRDLNPGNLIVEGNGGLVLIDYDQAAAGADFVGADRDGFESGLVKNDLPEFLDRGGLTRTANELLDALDEAWPTTAPFSLGVMGRRFGTGWHLDPLLEHARRHLDPIATAHVLDRSPDGPIAGLLLASAGASATAVVADPSRWHRLADRVDGRLRLVTDVTQADEHYDLVVALAAGADAGSPGPGPELGEMSSRTEVLSEPWFVTTAMTHVGRIESPTL